MVANKTPIRNFARSIPLPEFAARKQIIKLLMAPQPHHLEEDQLNDICDRTDGYSCADMTNLCKEAAYGPIRSISFQDIEHISPDQVNTIIFHRYIYETSNFSFHILSGSANN